MRVGGRVEPGGGDRRDDVRAMIEIYLEFRSYRCAGCRTELRFPADEGVNFAHFMLRGVSSGSLVAFSGHRGEGARVLKELVELLEESSLYGRLIGDGPSSARAHLLAYVVDPSDDGERYHMRAGPRCPNCGGALGGGRRNDPPEGIQVLVREATFEVWDRRTPPERRALRDAALEEWRLAFRERAEHPHSPLPLGVRLERPV